MKRLFKCNSAFFLAVALGTAGCGNQNLGQLLGQSASSSQNTTSSTGGTNPWAGVTLEGITSDPLIGTFQVFRIDTVNKLLILSFPLPVNPFGTSVGISYPIPQVPGATASVGPNSSGQQSFILSVPLKYLVKGLNFNNPAALPNGDQLPGVPAGELPELGVNFQNAKFSLFLYGNVKYFAVFVPTPGINPEVNLTFPINNSAGTEIIGYFATVAAQGTFAGGFFLSLVFPPELQAALDDIFS